MANSEVMLDESAKADRGAGLMIANPDRSERCIEEERKLPIARYYSLKPIQHQLGLSPQIKLIQT
ncbi:MAG: hypothetical protein SWY16_00585 [Cyanobacteriota bacterium]|nr:hypothetical protein [Cyanobacteriota bacterium]